MPCFRKLSSFVLNSCCYLVSFPQVSSEVEPLFCSSSVICSTPPPCQIQCGPDLLLGVLGGNLGVPDWEEGVVGDSGRQEN